MLTFISCVKFLSLYSVEITRLTKLTEARNLSGAPINNPFLDHGDFFVKFRRWGEWTLLCVNSSGISVWFEKDACLDYMGQTCPSYFDILSKNFSDMLDLILDLVARIFKSLKKFFGFRFVSDLLVYIVMVDDALWQ